MPCPLLALLLAASAVQPVMAQDLAKYSSEALEREVASIAESRIAVMAPMRDGVRLSTNIYTPKNARGQLPVTDGYDTLSWIAARGWSNGKVGTLGCSSSAE